MNDGPIERMRKWANGSAAERWLWPNLSREETLEVLAHLDAADAVCRHVEARFAMDETIGGQVILGRATKRLVEEWAQHAKPEPEPEHELIWNLLMRRHECRCGWSTPRQDEGVALANDYAQHYAEATA